MRGVLEADSGVTIASPTQSREHHQLDAVSPAGLGNYIGLQREEDPTQDGAYYRGDRRDLVGNGV